MAKQKTFAVVSLVGAYVLGVVLGIATLVLM